MDTVPTKAMTLSFVAPSASSLDFPTLPGAEPFSTISNIEFPPSSNAITAGSRMISKKDWEELKPTIRHLYLDQKRTLKQLAVYIKEHHGVTPTKKQLTHRISGWGFEKNVKRDERRAIIQSLSSEMKTASFETKSIRGRMLDKAKLDRWMKLEGISSEVGNGDESGLRSKPRFPNTGANATAENPLHPNPPVDQHLLPPACTEVTTGNEVVQLGSAYVFDWEVVDIMGSPTLCRLIGALTLEMCNDIPFLDLATEDSQGDKLLNCDLMDLCDKFDVTGSEAIDYPDSLTNILSSGTSQVRREMRLSVSTKTRPNSSTNNASWTFPLGFPQNELYPFPRSPGDDMLCSDRGSSYPITTSKWTESECRSRLRRLAYLKVEELTKLVASMATIALRYWNLGQYHMSERWYRYIVTATESMPKPRPYWIIRACLDVITDVAMQGRSAEARDLHQDLHTKVQHTFGPLHSLTLASKFERIDVLGNFETREEEEKACRELLQSCLNLHGARHDLSINVLYCLAFFLQRQKRFLESEQLLTIIISLRNGLITLLRESGLKTFSCEQNIFLDVVLLARVLNNSGKNTRSKDLLEEAKKRFPKIIEIEGGIFFSYQYELARIKRFAGELDDSEEILNDLLQRHGDSMPPVVKINVMRGLVEVLRRTNRLEEATIWLEKEFAILLDNVGLDKRFVKSICRRLRRCYAGMGRYDEAMLHFERMLESLASANSRRINNQQEYIQEIKVWMNQVDEMRSAALGTACAEL